MNKMMKFMTPILALSLAVSIPAVSFATDPATPTVGIEQPEQVCAGLDSGKIDVGNAGPSLEITAPAGSLISGYCVKAGSVKQGNGPEFVAVNPPAESVTVAHSSGKDISHYSVVYVPKTVSTPSPTVTPSETTSPSPEPTPELPTEEPQPTLIPTPGPTGPTESPEPTVTPTVTPTTPAPTVSPTPTEPVVSCPGLSAVGRFANASGNEATLTVTVNGEVRPFGLTAVDGTPLPGVFTVHPTDFEFPGIIHLLDLNVGDVVAITLTDGRTTDSDSGVVRDSCGVGVEVGIEKFVGPVIPPKPPVPPVPPVTPTKPPVKPTPVCDAYSGGCVTPPAEVDTPTVVITEQSETVDQLPLTGVNVGTLAVIAALLILLGFLGLRSGRLRR